MRALLNRVLDVLSAAFCGAFVEVTEDDKEAHGVIGTLQAYGLVIVSQGEAIRTADARFTMRNYVLERAAH